MTLMVSTTIGDRLFFREMKEKLRKSSSLLLYAFFAAASGNFGKPTIHFHPSSADAQMRGFHFR